MPAVLGHEFLQRKDWQYYDLGVFSIILSSNKEGNHR